tara:strand:+ start:1516 stop:1851 length:336 start_codon:yes stop_codon:yes gene_type:complete
MGRPFGSRNLTDEERKIAYEKVKAKKREQYHKDKKKLKEYQKQYYKKKKESEKEKIIEYQRSYYERNREKILQKRAYQKIYRDNKKKEKSKIKHIPSGNFNPETKKYLIQF